MKGFVAAILATALAAGFGPSAALAKPGPDPLDAKCRKWVAPTDPKDPDMRRAVLGRCLTAKLAFDPRAYFPSPGYDDPNEPAGIVDAVYDSSLRGSGWAFAIDTVCPPGPVGDLCPLKLRTVAWKAAESLPKGWREPLHGTAAETRAVLDVAAAWREADLASCPHALDTLHSLADASWFSFERSDEGAIEGKPAYPDVMVDGDWITVRARGGTMGIFTSSALNTDEGGASAWAQKMLEVAAPCLKPAPGPPPWRRTPN